MSASIKFEALHKWKTKLGINNKENKNQKISEFSPKHMKLTYYQICTSKKKIK
jgi:hypothetical protein